MGSFKYEYSRVTFVSKFTGEVWVDTSYLGSEYDILSRTLAFGDHYEYIPIKVERVGVDHPTRFTDLSELVETVLQSTDLPHPTPIWDGHPLI